MKINDLKNYNNQELRNIKKLLDYDILDLLPEKIKDFILTENPLTGNVITRTIRIKTLINQEIVIRFMNI